MIYLNINDDILKNCEIANRNRYKYLKKTINFILKNQLDQLKFDYKLAYKQFTNEYLGEMIADGLTDELEEIEKDFYEIVENLKNDTLDGETIDIKYYCIGANSKIVLDNYYLEFYDECNRFYRMYLYINKHGVIDLISENNLLDHDH